MKTLPRKRSFDSPNFDFPFPFLGKQGSPCLLSLVLSVSLYKPPSLVSATCAIHCKPLSIQHLEYSGWRGGFSCSLFLGCTDFSVLSTVPCWISFTSWSRSVFVNLPPPIPWIPSAFFYLFLSKSSSVFHKPLSNVTFSSKWCFLPFYCPVINVILLGPFTLPVYSWLFLVHVVPGWRDKDTEIVPVKL